jgi:phosphatidylserine/phosphatidylglycerophosphate/cardiolipin synthase-like enzyme
MTLGATLATAVVGWLFVAWALGQIPDPAARKDRETSATYPSTKPAAITDGISVYFSPKGGCTEAIVQQIGEAKHGILIQAYSFTSAPIAKAVTDAHKRGVSVTAVLDASNRTAQYSAATFLFNAGVPVFIDPNHAIAHNKIMLIDGRTIITGSFNYSKAAEESNAENLLVIKDKPELFAAFEANFRLHLAHSIKYEGKPDAISNERAPPTTLPAVPTTQQSPRSGVVVYVTKTGKKYHREGCAFLSKSSIPMDLATAKAKGYTPCSKCDPPQ